MTHTNTWETDGVYRIFTGEVSAEDILKSNFELQNDPDFLEIKYIINDFTGITGIKFNEKHNEIYAKTDNIFALNKGKLKIAIIVNRDEFIPLAENYKQLMQDSTFECEIFNTLEEAREWTSS